MGKWGIGPMEPKAINVGVVSSMLERHCALRPGELQPFRFYLEEPEAISALPKEQFGNIKSRLSTTYWYRLKMRNRDVDLSRSRWVERAWHGFKAEALAAQLRDGLIPSSSDRIGARTNVASNIFCCSDNRVTNALNYSNLVPSGDNVYWSFMWELSVDRGQLIPQKRQFQWSQPKGSVCRNALWVWASNFQDIHNNWLVQAVWQPLFECP